MNLDEINRFFKELKTEENNTEFILPYMNMLDAFSRIIGQSIYIVDYHKRGFVYVSPNPLFLCGYKPEEVLKMGYSFYKEVVVQEDLKILMEIDQKGYELFCKLPAESKLKSMISFNYRLKQPENGVIMVNERNTPLCLTKEGEVRYALCVISLSTTNPEDVIIKIDDTLQKYTYSFEKKTWSEVKEVKITKREKSILQLSTQGYSNEEIANLLFIDTRTVKFHKTNIFSKLNVQNITEAITFAYNNKLI